MNAGDGFVFSQILKGTKGRRYAEKFFDENGWTENANGTYKYKLFEEDCPGLDREGNSVVRRRIALLYWDKADADIARRKREENLKKPPVQQKTRPGREMCYNAAQVLA